MKTQQEHIDAKGNHCPFCNSDEIEGGSFTVDNGKVFQPTYCLNCDKGWENEYTLSDYSTEDTDDDNATAEALAKVYNPRTKQT